MELANLMKSMALANNGYLFAPSAEEIACAKANPGAVNFADGKIFKKGLIPSSHIQKRDFSEAFDYEGAILSRQENQMMDF